MGRNPLPQCKRFFTSFAAWVLFFLAPDLLRLYPHPYTAALADGCAWAGDKAKQGLASLTFLFAVAAACQLTLNAYRWITDASAPAPAPAPPTPAALEEGLTVLEVEVGPAPSHALPSPSSGTTTSSNAISGAHATTGGLILIVLLSTLFFVWQFFFVHRNEIISPARPVLENVGAAALWILRGWEVVFVAGMVAAAVGWVRKKRAAALEAEPTNVLFEGGLTEEEETPAPAEKVYAEEKA